VLWISLAAVLVLVLAGGWWFGYEKPTRERAVAEQRRLEEARVEAERQRLELEKRLADEREAFRLANARGGLTVRAEPAGVQVKVGDQEPAAAPLTLKELHLGRLKITACLAGHDDWTGEVEIKENITAELEIKLERSTGGLKLRSEPEGIAYELVPSSPSCGEPRKGTLPTALEKLPTGAYTLTTKMEGWPDQVKSISIERGKTEEISFDFVPGELVVESVPAGATVFINGNKEGITPLTLTGKRPGSASVELRLPGYKPTTLKGEIKPRQTARLTATLEKRNAPVFGRPYRIDDIALPLMPIPAGSYVMGSEKSKNRASKMFGRIGAMVGMGGADMEGDRSNEYAQTQVTLTQRFWMSRTEVNQAQYEAVMGTNPSANKDPEHPVDSVSWEDACEFCRRLTAREAEAGFLPEGYVYSLPTEAQWEYACRSGTPGDYAGVADQMGWFVLNSDGQAHPVGQKQGNTWGLKDMYGNVSEWCLDWYEEKHPGTAVTDYEGPAQGVLRVIRGGAYDNKLLECRSASRAGKAPSSNAMTVGFRVVLTRQGSR